MGPVQSHISATSDVCLLASLLGDYSTILHTTAYDIIRGIQLEKIIQQSQSYHYHGDRHHTGILQRLWAENCDETPNQHAPPPPRGQLSPSGMRLIKLLEKGHQSFKKLAAAVYQYLLERDLCGRYYDNQQGCWIKFRVVKLHHLPIEERSPFLAWLSLAGWLPSEASMRPVH